MDYLCYHHNDMDGKAAANEVRLFLEGSGVHCTANDFIMKGYDDPFNEKDYDQKIVFIVDLSFTTNNVTKLLGICEKARKVIWIDHHKSSLEIIEDDSLKHILDKYDNLEYYLNNNACGAVLTFLYFKGIIDTDIFDIFGFENTFIRYHVDSTSYTVGDIISYKATTINEMAHLRFLNLIDLYDRWVFDDNQEPVLFNYGTYSNNTNLYLDNGELNEFWEKILNPFFIEDIIRKGTTIKNYIRFTADDELKARSYECKIGWLKGIALNMSGNSMVFGDLIKKYDIVCLWEYDGKNKKYVYSLYTDRDDVDCTKIAQSYNKNGGGHRKAAGFSSDYLVLKP